MTDDRVRYGEPTREPPDYDPALLSHVATRIEISNVELVALEFSRSDDAPLPGELPQDACPTELGISVDGWALDKEQRALGCVVSFRTFFDDVSTTAGDAAEPYYVMGSFRISYRVKPGNDAEELDDEAALNHFAHWNAVFNAWPYWRELLTSVINRAQLPRYLVPVIGVPMPAQTPAHEA